MDTQQLGYETNENIDRPQEDTKVHIEYPCIFITNIQDIPEKKITQDKLTLVASAVRPREEFVPQTVDITQEKPVQIKYPLYIRQIYHGKEVGIYKLFDVPDYYFDTLFKLMQNFDLRVYIPTNEGKILELKDRYVFSIVPASL